MAKNHRGVHHSTDRLDFNPRLGTSRQTSFISKKPWDSVLRGVHHSIRSRRPRLQNTGISARMTQKFDCAAQNPAAASFFILSRFRTREACTYRSSVMVVVACPSTSESDLISNPTSTARVANVCPYGIITTNRKSPVYQGFSVIWQGFGRLHCEQQQHQAV